MPSILSADWVLPVDRDPIRDGAVALEDGRIAAVGTIEELAASGDRTVHEFFHARTSA